MSRAALLPQFGDPFGLAYWLSWYRRCWWQEVDALYILCSNVLSPEVASEMDKMIEETNRWVHALDPEKRIYWQIQLPGVQHGDGIALLLKTVQEDHLVLLEDDTIVFKPGYLNYQFERLESGEFDIIGSPRGSCAQCIIDASIRKYGAPNLPEGSYDNSCNFWPNFFFARTDILFETDLMFNAKGWDAGDRIEQLDLTITEPSFGDTFVWASIQLRAIEGIKIGYCEQFHGHPDDLLHYTQDVNVFSGSAGWVHHGSLSGWRMLVDQPHNHVIPGLDIGEMARRLQWYFTYVEYCEKHYASYLPELRQQYKGGALKIQLMYSIADNDIIQRQRIYKHLLGQHT